MIENERVFVINKKGLIDNKKGLIDNKKGLIENERVFIGNKRVFSTQLGEPPVPLAGSTDVAYSGGRIAIPARGSQRRGKKKEPRTSKKTATGAFWG